ncbi:MAG: hypothetical protein ACOH2K_17875 [Burkholderiaceae bacterium]
MAISLVEIIFFVILALHFYIVLTCVMFLQNMGIICFGCCLFNVLADAHFDNSRQRNGNAGLE